MFSFNIKTIGFDSVINRIGAKLKKYQYQKKTRVIVGFAMPYAIYVHENLEAKHPVGEAKFLYIAGVRDRPKLVKMVAYVLNNGGTLENGLLMAARELLLDARNLTPKDTAALRVSGYTSTEAMHATSFAQARELGMAHREFVLQAVGHRKNHHP